MWNQERKWLGQLPQHQSCTPGMPNSNTYPKNDKSSCNVCTPQDSEVDSPAFIQVSEEGHSVLAHIHGFEPYFYVECPQAVQTWQVGGGLNGFRFQMWGGLQ